MHGFRAADGWFIVQVGREPQFAALVELIGRPELGRRPALRRAPGLGRPPRGRAPPGHRGLGRGPGPASRPARPSPPPASPPGPCFTDDEVVADPHVAARSMLVEVPRTDGVEQPVLVPGNPVKLSGVAEGPETRVPWLGEHTDEVLAAELGLADADLASSRGATAPSRLGRSGRGRCRWSPTTSFDVPVAGGALHVGRWGDGPTRGRSPPTASRATTGPGRAWPGSSAPDVTLIAPDLRGRGRLRPTCPGPFGMRAHAEDLVGRARPPRPRPGRAGRPLDGRLRRHRRRHHRPEALVLRRARRRRRRPARCPTASTPTPCWPASSARRWPGSR